MIEPLDMHHDLLARLEDHVRLDSARPAGDPLRRVARAVVGDDQQMLDARLFHHCLQRATAPRILGVRETGVLLRDDLAQARREIEHG